MLGCHEADEIIGGGKGGAKSGGQTRANLAQLLSYFGEAHATNLSHLSSRHAFDERRAEFLTSRTMTMTPARRLRQKK